MSKQCTVTLKEIVGKIESITVHSMHKSDPTTKHGGRESISVLTMIMKALLGVMLINWKGYD